MVMDISLGEQLVRALTAQQYHKVGRLFAEKLDFRGVTPYGAFEAKNVDELCEIFKKWYAFAEHVDFVENSEFYGKHKINYVVKNRISSNDIFFFEQTGFYEVSEDTISSMHLVCSGDRRVCQNCSFGFN